MPTALLERWFSLRGRELYGNVKTSVLSIPDGQKTYWPADPLRDGLGSGFGWSMPWRMARH